MLAPNVIIPFDGAEADIPVGFSRVSAMDGRFPKGALSGLGDTGGSNTHTHSLSHTHTVEPHTHSFSVHQARDIESQHDAGTSGGKVDKYHSHYGTATSGAAGSEESGTTDINYDSASSLPPYYEVIFIKSDKYNFIPVNGLIFRLTARGGLTLHSASTNRFLRGAAAGEDAGAIGGLTNHSHTQTHTHTANAHSHGTGYTAYDTGAGEDGGSSPSIVDGNHRHSFNISNATQNMNSDSTPTDSTAVEPYNRTLKHYYATAKTLVQVGDIVMTMESENPIGWIDCDGSNDTPDMDGFYVKNNATADTVSGSNTHNHSHTHNHTGSGSHTHSHDQYSAYSGSGTGGHNGSGRTVIRNHRHEIYNPSSVTADYSSETLDTTTVNNEPEYIKVKFIMATITALGGGGAAVIPAIME